MSNTTQHPSVADDAEFLTLLSASGWESRTAPSEAFDAALSKLFAHIDTLLAAAREEGRNDAYEEYSHNENAAWNAYNTSGCWGHEPTVKAIFTDGYRAAQPPAAIVALKNLVDELIASDEEGLIAHVESMQKAMSMLKNEGAQIQKATTLAAAQPPAQAEQKCPCGFDGAACQNYNREGDCTHKPAQAEARQQIPDGWQLVPKEPLPEMWSGLARDIVMAWRFNNWTPRKMAEFMEDSGNDVPDWLRSEPEMGSPDHTISKGTCAVLLYKAMLADAPAAPQQETGQ